MTRYKDFMCIEKHTYAPELNKVFINGIEIKVNKNIVFGISGQNSKPEIKKGLNRYFKPLVNTRFCRIHINHSKHDHKFYDHEYSGWFNNSEELLNTVRKIKQKHNLSDTNISITFKRGK